ncbi:ATP-dependent RecD-like DNA helicase [Candidatus Clavichlamydia salmonicola]|uniref:SF1B family DNA helicase RecD2 n=1 Tax=Candidatus Clavichlamydia salmonicola TaxID=469812 RepID=UPI001891B3C2|nr:ATP-dependent RecD-like DNA helicase [Candidatus Clavichlamydia salmonicola]MBF5050837.1 ATP-dependent RecD-like DNA helicase [Candidatus Clavichlamydia salmonicola]
MEQIFGYIDHLVFKNNDNGFTVAKLKQAGKKELATITGNLDGIEPGEELRLQGDWVTTAPHGKQFSVQSVRADAPKDEPAIFKYLTSGAFKGIGPSFASKIIARFGNDTLKIIDENPQILSDIPGLGKKRLEGIIDCFSEQKAFRDLIFFLQNYDISRNTARRIFKIFGNKAAEKIRENPFSLARNIPGFGFKTADTIAYKIGILSDSSIRIRAGIEFVLISMSDDGHTCCPQNLLIEKTQEMLSDQETCAPLIEASLILTYIDALIFDQRLFRADLNEEATIWLKGFWLCEQGIAAEMKRIEHAESQLRTIDHDKAIKWAEETLKIDLADLQKIAVSQSLSEKIHIITGGPGTGKSTVTKAIIRITEKLSRSIILSAPTGRAAKRITEITRRRASTIHGLLQYDFRERSFRKNKEHPLVCDLIIIDEASMIDTALMYHLLKAIPSNTRLIFIGDIYQLPSVGPGNVLKDLIASKSVSVTHLTEIFRQAHDSRIIVNAHRINSGLFPDFSPQDKCDFLFYKHADPQEALDFIVELASKKIPARYNFDVFDDIQILSPMKKGILGITNLNKALQQTINPQTFSLIKNGEKFSLGDKVMQMKNNYNKEVFNGDIGRISSLDTENRMAVVSFDDKQIPYNFSELDELSLAYATSIHKYQGSESTCVIIPVHTSHFMMLHRNLLYTAVTRGRRLVVLVGMGKAIAIAVSRDGFKQRKTGLESALQAKTIPIDPLLQIN